jgi:hypothetical protein
MRKIYKYSLVIADEQAISLPKDAEILAVQVQGGTLCLWAIVFPGNENELKAIEIYGTGHDFPTIGQGERKYISTVQMGGFVWHVFEALTK